MVPIWMPQVSRIGIPPPAWTGSRPGSGMPSTSGPDLGSGSLTGSHTNRGQQWYNKPFFVILACLFILYSIFSLLAFIALIAKGTLDWKLNIMPRDYGLETDGVELWTSEDEDDPGTYIRHYQSEPRARTGIDGVPEEQLAEQSWESIEMHPFRRNPVVHTRTRLGSHRDLQEMQDLVSAHLAMRQQQGPDGLGEESRRQATTRLANRLNDNVEARVRRYAEMEWRLQRIGLF